MSIEITNDNCHSVIGAGLCNLPCECKGPITTAICRGLENFVLDCDKVKDCETLTTLSEFTVTGNQVCITYRDENEDSFERCFDMNQSQVLITADNGLTADSLINNVQLGGTQSVPAPLLHDTYIISNGFSLNMSGLTLNDNGSAQLIDYGMGAFADTPVYALGVTISGDIIEYNPSAGGAITVDNGLNFSTATNIQLGGDLTAPTFITSSGFDISISGLTLFDTQRAQLTAYGLGDFLDTPVYGLGVLADGNVIEYVLPVEVTADNGLSINTPTNIQLGSDTLTGAPLLHDTYISGAFNLSLQDGSLTVGTDTPLLNSKITAITVDNASYFSVFARKQNDVTGTAGAGIASEGQYLVTGGTNYFGDGPLGGLYGELAFLGSGNWTYSGPQKYSQLGGLSAVMTIYTPDTSSYNSGNSIFSGGQYFLNAAGSGNIDKFASIRPMYPLATPGLSFTGTITDHYSIFIDDYLDSNIYSTITNRWGIYQKGVTERNVFFGAVGIGIEPTAGDLFRVESAGKQYIYVYPPNETLLLSSGTSNSILMDDVADSIVYTANVHTFNGVVSGPINANDSTFALQNNSDPTKQVHFSLTAISPSSNWTWTFPNVSGTFASIDNAQTFSGLQTFSNGLSTAGLTITGSSNITAASATHTFPSTAGSVMEYNDGGTASGSLGFPTGDRRVNWYQFTALALAVTFQAPSGTPLNHNELYIRIKDNGTTKAITWDGIYRASTDLPLPTATTGGKTLYLKFIYNSADSKWDLIQKLDNF